MFKLTNILFIVTFIKTLHLRSGNADGMTLLTVCDKCCARCIDAHGVHDAKCEAECKALEDLCDCDWFIFGPGVPICLSEFDSVLTSNGQMSLLRDIVIGDYVFDGDSFTKVLTVEYGPKQGMIKFFMTNINNSTHKSTITMTSNHLLYDNVNKLITASEIKIGSIIWNNFIINKIENDYQFSSTPVTFSGYLQINNGVKVSSYIRNEKYAKLCHDFLTPFRWISNNINQQITGKVVEWIVTDHHKYYRQISKVFGKQVLETKSTFYLFAPVVAVVTVSFRLWLPISLFIITLIFMKRKSYN